MDGLITYHYPGNQGLFLPPSIRSMSEQGRLFDHFLEIQRFLILTHWNQTVLFFWGISRKELEFFSSYFPSFIFLYKFSFLWNILF